MSAGQAATADRRFEGKRVLVTGAGSGLGMVVAEAFARQGASVVLSGRSAEKLSKVKAAVEERGGTALAVPTDIRQQSDVDALFKVIESEWETLDIVVNNAGMGRPAWWVSSTSPRGRTSSRPTSPAPGAACAVRST